MIFSNTKSASAESAAAAPPLPDVLPFEDQSPQAPVPPISPIPLPIPPILLRSLRHGCYLLNYTPSSGGLVTYDGTLRVEVSSAGRTASGDLYQRPTITIPTFPPPSHPITILLPGPNPASGIPILSRGRYRYYLRVTLLLEGFTTANNFTLGFEMHRFNSATKTWTNEGTFKAQMFWKPAPAGYPAGANYLEGDVKNAANVTTGKLTMGWISSYLRKATVEIDRVAVSEAPLNNGAGVDWKSVFDEVGWDLTVAPSNADVAEPSGESWSDAEMHSAMLARRDASNLDVEWRYHVLAVRKIDSTPRGIMYDAGGTDSNNVPREGVGISSHWIIPNTPDWGLVKGLRFGTAAKAYFRTVVHETGHAMGLYHNTVDLGFMNTTDVIAAAGTATTPFPNNIKWSYASNDLMRLRHFPDIYVRPGGTPFGTSYATTPLSPPDEAVQENGLELRVSPLLEAVPLGAPVRVNLELFNGSGSPQQVPPSLSLKAGTISGAVTDPAGTVRSFSPIVICLEEQEKLTLKPGKSITGSLTLLRGKDGALFPSAGLYRITAIAHWEANGVDYYATGETNMMVTPVVDEAHAQAALKVLATPDALPALVFGGDHLIDGIAAIQAAVENPVLRPHFAYVEAKRMAERFGKRKANLKAASELLDDATVMTGPEVKKAAKLVKAEGGASAPAKSITKMLKHKVKAQQLDDDVKETVDSI